MRFLVAILLVFSFSSLAQVDIPLVGNKDGQWRIFNDGKEIILPRTVHYVSPFDEKELAYYAENNLVGIINSKGEIINDPVFRDVKSLGNGFFQCFVAGKQTIIDYTDPSLRGLGCDEVSGLTQGWVKVQRNDSTFVFNSFSKKYIHVPADTCLIKSDFGFVYVKEDTTHVMYNREGERFVLTYDKNSESISYVRFHKDFMVFQTADMTKLVLRSKVIDLPVDTWFSYSRHTDLVYSYGGKTYFVDKYTGAINKQLPYDRVHDVFKNDEFIYVGRKDLWGVYSWEKGELIRPQYDWITTYDDAHFYVSKNENQGIVTRNGSIIVPVIYAYVWDDGRFFRVSNAVDLMGAISKKTHRKVAECIYDFLDIGEHSIKAYSGSKIRIIEFDENHRVTNTLTLDNVKELNQKQRYRRNDGVDTRLFAIGWFTEKQKKFDKQGFFLGYIDNWGFRDKRDSITVKAKHAQPKYIPGANFTLVPQDSVEYDFGGVKRRLDCFFTSSNKDGRSLFQEKVFALDTSDFNTRAFARFTTEKGMGIISQNGKPEYLMFVGSEENENIRFCESGTLANVKNVNDPMAISYDRRMYEYNFQNFDIGGDGVVKLKMVIDKEEVYDVKLEEAKWNFLDTAGNRLFDKPFSYVQEFYKERAIVKRGGWGVVSADTLIIPCSYSSIERVSEYGDTMFLLKKASAGYLYYDTTVNEIPLGITKYLRKLNDLVQVQIGNNKAIVNSNYELLSGDSKSQKLMPNNWFYTKAKRRIHIHDTDGSEIGEYAWKPIERLTAEHFIFKPSSKLGVLNSYGDTVLDFKYKRIEPRGADYIIAIDGAANLLYNKDFKLIRKLKANDALADPVTGNYAVLTNDMVKVYLGETKKKLGKIKEIDASFYHNSWFVQTGKVSFALNLEKERRDFDFEIVEIEPIDGIGYLVMDKEKEYHIFDTNWQPVRTVPLIKKVRYLGKGIFTGKLKSDILVFTLDTTMVFTPKTEILGDFNSPYILVKERGKCYFLNPDLKNTFGRYYIDAVPFMGEYAAVSQKEGWTIIDKNGTLKTLPTYTDMDIVAPNIFSLPKFALYGLADNNGNEILPVEFKKITFLAPDIIQVIHDGDIRYFDSKGTEIKIYGD